MEVLTLQTRVYHSDGSISITTQHMTQIEVLTLQTRVCYRSINITITSILPGLKY